jgi:hypothetical protein
VFVFSQNVTPSGFDFRALDDRQDRQAELPSVAALVEQLCAELRGVRYREAASQNPK